MALRTSSHDRLLWYSKLLWRALKSTPDVDQALLAVDMALDENPFPDETEIEKPDDQGESWREEDEPLGTSDGKPVDAAFAFDIFNRRAQGILNRALQEATGLSAKARRDLRSALAVADPTQMALQVVQFVNLYRYRLADLLGTTQVASLLEGAREVAGRIPRLQPPGANAPLPPTLPPEDAADLIERLQELSTLEREEAIYQRAPAEQRYLRAALRLPAEPTPSFTPPAPPPGTPERVHFPVIETAARELASKNVLTRSQYDRLDDAARSKAFTVTGVDARETLTKIRDKLAENVGQGVDLETFRQEVLDAVGQGTFLSDAHLETVFRTNVQGAFSDGQQRVLQHPHVRSGFPYAAYEAIHDDRVRETHLEVEKHGIGQSNVFRTDDPVFEQFRPPWEWNCRCSWIPLTVRQAAEKGVEEAQRWLEQGTEPSPPAFVNPLPFAPPAGFQRATLSVQLSAQPLEDWEKEEEPEIEASSVMATACDFSPETKSAKGPIKAKNSAPRKKSLRGGRRGKRRLSRDVRVPRTWKLLLGNVVQMSTELAVAHAPRGGITLKGKFFRGGEFIPGKYLGGATAEEKAKIGKTKPASGKTRYKAYASQIERFIGRGDAPGAREVWQELSEEEKTEVFSRLKHSDRDQILSDQETPAESVPEAPREEGELTAIPSGALQGKPVKLFHSERSGRLDPATARSMLGSCDKILQSFSETARQAAVGNIDDVYLFRDAKDIAKAAAEDMPDLKEILLEEGTTVWGCYNSRDRRLYLNGGNKLDSMEELYAHELMHAVDGSFLDYSLENDWQSAWEEEIKQPGIPLSRYATTSQTEGLAEFFRLLYGGSRPDLATVEQTFPLSSAFLKRTGLWPEVV